MTPAALLVGLDERSSEASAIAGVLLAAGLRPHCLTRWADWRVSVFADTGACEITHARESGVRIARGELRLIILFGYPELPVVDPADAQYQALEYDALLFGLCSVATPRLAARWSYVAAAYSDAEQEIGDAGRDPLDLSPVVRWLRSLGAEESVTFGEMTLARLPDESIAVTTALEPATLLPVTVQCDSSTGRFTPYVGVVPTWVAGAPALLHRLLTFFMARGSGTECLIHAPPYRADTAGPAGSIAVAANGGDSTAVHVIHRARLRAAPIELFELNWLYDSRCSEDAFAAALMRLRVAHAVFARPILVRPEGPDAHIAIDRHLRTIRTLQQRTGMTFNALGAGHTNVSKSAHVYLLVTAGAKLPATLATNDPTAARAFAREFGQPIYKSGSWMRSLAARLDPGAEARLDLLPNCPALFQRFIDGDNCRAHVVIGELHAVRLRADQWDYRAALAESYAGAMVLPREAEEQVVETMRASRLGLGGCDLKWDSTRSEWNLLEINRMPAIDVYDHLAGGRVADAVVDRLMFAGSGQ